ncbi:hypothetical protein Bca4012_064322 [Brassica carinata]
MNVANVLLVSGRFEGVSELPGNLLYGLKDAEVVPDLKRKELLDIYVGLLQIRQFCVNEDPPDPMMAGAWYELVELSLDAYNAYWTSWFSPDVFWSDWNCLKMIKPKDCPIFP